MDKICKNCRYFREGYWCSNFASVYFRFSLPEETKITAYHTCDEFTQDGKKAPWWMRFTNWIIKGSER